MELEEILKDHKVWISTYGESGQRLNLKDTDLKCVDFSRLNLEYSNFEGSNLEGSNLKNADLRWANLKYTQFYNVCINNSWLEGVELEGAKGILQWQSPQEDRNICYSVKYDNCIMHQLGDFWGDTKSAIVSIRKKYGLESLCEKFLLLQVEALENE